MVATTTLAVASSLVSAGASIAGGFAKAGAMRSGAKAAELNAKVRDIRATQAKAAGYEETNDVMGRINALRSARGVSLDSATGRAIAKDRRKRGMEKTNANVLTELMGRDAANAKGRSLRKGAKYAQVGGFVSAFGDIAQAGKDAKDGGWY